MEGEGRVVKTLRVSTKLKVANFGAVRVRVNMLQPEVFPQLISNNSTNEDSLGTAFVDGASVFQNLHSNSNLQKRGVMKYRNIRPPYYTTANQAQF